MTVDHKNNVDTIHCLVGTIHCLDGTIHHKLIPFIAYCIALFEVILCLRRNPTLIRPRFYCGVLQANATTDSPSVRLVWYTELILQ